MSSGPIFYVDWENEDDKHRPHRCPVVHIYEDGERLEIITPSRGLKTISKTEIKGVRWE